MKTLYITFKTEFRNICLHFESSNLKLFEVIILTLRNYIGVRKFPSINDIINSTTIYFLCCNYNALNMDQICGLKAVNFRRWCVTVLPRSFTCLILPLTFHHHLIRPPPLHVRLSTFLIVFEQIATFCPDLMDAVSFCTVQQAHFLPCAFSEPLAITQYGYYVREGIPHPWDYILPANHLLHNA